MTSPTANVLDPAQERKLAAALFNHTWDLLTRPERSAADDQAMIHAAHASRHHWGVVGTPRNHAVGDWQIARVYATLGRAEPALCHARLALEVAERHDLGPFLVGCGHEVMARACAVAKDRAAFDRHFAEAERLAAQVTDAEDAKVLRDDLASLSRP